MEKVDARYEWREAHIENGITKNLSTFVRAYHGYLRLAIVCRYEFYGRRQLPRTRRRATYYLYTEESVRLLLGIRGNSYFLITIDFKVNARTVP